MQAHSTEAVTLFFDDLKEATTYTVYVTASAALPYEDPVSLFEDFQVVNVTFTTPPNPNLHFNEITLLKSLEKLNPQLARALLPSLASTSNEQVNNNKK